MAITFQYYLGGIKSNVPAGKIDLETFIERHENPEGNTLDLLDRIALASEKGDKKLKVSLKEKLPFVTPAVIVAGLRRYDNIDCFTGLAQIDFDGVDNASDLKHHLFETYPQFYTVYTSPSLKGVKGLMRIPICDSVAEYQEYYAAIQEEFEGYYGFDPAPKNAVLPLFVSYDYFILSRKEPEIWQKRKKKEESFHTKYPLPPRPYSPTKANSKNELRALRTVRKMIGGIVDNGHPQLRSACLILGTRVAAGYVQEHVARQEVENLIASHGYLRKGVKGYTTTANWAITEGMRTPKFY